MKMIGISVRIWDQLLVPNPPNRKATRCRIFSCNVLFRTISRVTVAIRTALTTNPVSINLMTGVVPSIVANK